MKQIILLILLMVNSVALAHSPHNSDAAIQNRIQMDSVNLSEDKNMISMTARIDLSVGGAEKDHLMQKLQRISQIKNVKISIEDLGGYPQSKLHIVLKGKKEKVKKILFKLDKLSKSN